MSCGIYKIVNLINNKVYIGQSINIEDRFRHHKNTAFNKNAEAYKYPLYQAIRKYGIENFKFEIIEECSVSDLDKKENFYMEQYNSLSYGYNQVYAQQAGTKKTPKEIVEIQQLLLNSNISTIDIGKQYNLSDRSIRSINTGTTWRDDSLVYPLRKKNTHNQKYLCIDCGCEVHKGSLRCVKCSHLLQRKIERPSREELKKLIREQPFTQIGKKFNVTDNTIRKWCISEHLPKTKKEINSYSEEEWNKI